MAKCRGRGGTAFVTAALQNSVPCASRSAAVAFFAQMDIVVQWQGGGCGYDGSIDGGGNVVMLTENAGFGWHNESGQGGEEEAVKTAVAML